MIELEGLRPPRASAPVVRAVDLSGEPIDVAAAMADVEGFVFLDSSDVGLEDPCFSVLAWAPEATLRTKGDRAVVRARPHEWRGIASPLDVMARLVGPESGRASGGPAVPESGRASGGPAVPYCGGAIGYVGYDLFPFVERYERLTAVDDLSLPDCRLGFYDAMLVFDHRNGTWLQTGRAARGSEDVVDTFDSRLAEVQRALARGGGAGRAAAREPVAEDGPDSAPQSSFSRAQYVAAVERAIHHIVAGDVYQVNLSQRFHATMRASAFDLFQALRRINPSRYGAYLSYPGHGVVSASPELFLRRSGQQVETHPIKGTRPRGADPATDASLRRDLLESVKDRAELSMIVDLMRNDLGRVCDYGSVEVAEHRRIEALPTVFHTVSSVHGRLREGTTAVDLLRAAFPGGSVTGCPKIRAVEIIDELEPTKRNAYTGAIGYVGYDGDLCLNVAIRTMITKGHDVFYQVGGGIVADSDPDAEYAETLHKGAAMQHAIRMAGRDADV